MKFEPHAFQVKTINRMIAQKQIAAFIDMGCGKTVCALSAISQLKAKGECKRVLVIAPLKVAECTWDEEIKKWDHLKVLTYSKVIGNIKTRLKALETKADIYIVSRDNVKWLVDIDRNFDTIIVDESSSFKAPKTARFKALKKFKPSRIMLLTGTPCPNGLMGLWAQIYLLDRGQRLESSFYSFRDKYFTPAYAIANVVVKWNLRPGAQQAIERAINDIAISLTAEDYIDMPPKIDNTINLSFDKTLQAKYRAFVKDLILNEPVEIVANNQGALLIKLLQFTNGAIYDDARNIIDIHTIKLDALSEIIDDRPVLIFYNFIHDRERILERFKNARILRHAGDIADWNAGNIPIMLAHPASCAYGLNLQAGGNIIVWYGLTFNLEQYLQANARLYRQGQINTVIIHHLIIKDTIDEIVMKALKDKRITQDKLIQSVKNWSIDNG
jgi:SNF2 family DNA or RNA helicase